MASRPNQPNTATVDISRPSSLPPPPDVIKIVNAPIDIVRAVLIALCQDPKQEKIAMGHFAKLQELRSKQHEGVNDDAGASHTYAPNPDKTEGKDSNDGRAGANVPSKKRAPPEIRICALCNEPFIEDEDSPSACMYHPGPKAVNEDSSIWEEYDWDREDADPALGGT
ncbi:hypothetical protein GGR58DRAFT_453079 [Xylaria digitata]|nr:hypothetical protein GGR58DRAFT_453079 [Xylaria digitata]